MINKALVVLSGGQDSTTCLYWALSQFDEVQTLSFDYGQRHKIELESAKKIADIADVPNQILPIDTFRYLEDNVLISEKEIEENLGEKLRNERNDSHLPNTFVPGRNLIFMTFATAFAYQYHIQDLVTGVCQTDYSGYPDCRQNTITALELALNLGMESRIKLHTPLMWMTKAQSVLMAEKLGALEALAWSHTCYKGQFPPCAQCSACQLRAKGFDDAGIADPLFSRTQ